ncbi:Tryptophan--tRNA ligase, mitochondrial [Thecaphora frezii]
MVGMRSSVSLCRAASAVSSRHASSGAALAAIRSAIASPSASSSSSSTPRSHPLRSLTTPSSPPKPKTIFSGIQPTGIPHLGNYLGALRNWVDLQNTASPNDTLLFSIVGMHALTMPQDPKLLFRERREMMAILLAIGLDPERCTIFHQDQVKQHAELAWYLMCLTPFGKLGRMTTWKSKIATARNGKDESSVDESQLALGLFAYPVLQAADILLYRSTHVPVGEDQVQHLELSRDIADLFNRTFKRGFFPLPQHMITPTKRVLSLRDPSSKMSKSAPDVNSRILLTDTPSQIATKIRKAVTDAERTISYDPVNRPGVSNLLSILSGLSSDRDATPSRVAEQLNAAMEEQARQEGKELASGKWLKEAVVDVCVEALRPIQQKLERIKQDQAFLDQVEQTGRQKAEEMAEATMQRVRKLLGVDA